MNREDIYAALFAKVSKAASFNTISRRLKHWQDVSSVNQPALFQAQAGETARPAPQGVPPKWDLEVSLYLYAFTPDATQSASQVLNPLLDAVTLALAPENQVTNRQTLGGLVEHCWIEGKIETDEGALGDQSVAIIPIRILAV